MDEGPIEVDLPRALDPKERALFELFLAVNDEYNLNTTIRVAGGWVRDILYSKKSDQDLDIALEGPSPSVWRNDVKEARKRQYLLNGTSEEEAAQERPHHYITGMDFAYHVMAYLQAHSDIAQQASDRAVGPDHVEGEKELRVSKIKENPEQSKHLETAKIDLFGFDLDIVHLRTEDYTQGSRIPTLAAQPASPLDDALRRDLTINSLFYNINNSKVQDYTRRGISDLHNKIIRTPLEARTTFADDPLRMLRCVRFATRFGFEVDQSIIDSTNNQEVNLAQLLFEKVSRERIGIEVEKMFKLNSAGRSLDLIEQMGLVPVVFREFEVRKGGALKGEHSSKPLWPEGGESHAWKEAKGLCARALEVNAEAPISHGQVVANLAAMFLKCSPQLEGPLAELEDPNSQIVPIARLLTEHSSARMKDFVESTITSNFKYATDTAKATAVLITAAQFGRVLIQRWLRVFNIQPDEVKNIDAKTLASLTEYIVGFIKVTDENDEVGSQQLEGGEIPLEFATGRTLVGEWAAFARVHRVVHSTLSTTAPQGKNAQSELVSVLPTAILLAVLSLDKDIHSDLGSKIRVGIQGVFEAKEIFTDSRGASQAAGVLPLFDGNTLVQQLGLARGPAIGRAIEVLLRFQIAQPHKINDTEHFWQLLRKLPLQSMEPPKKSRKN